MNNQTIHTEYNGITLQEMVEFVATHPEFFPKGMKTVVTCGDFEGNYEHRKFELYGDKARKGELFIGYEMHEGDGY